MPAQYRGYTRGRTDRSSRQIILGPLFIALGLFIGAAIFHVPS